MLFQVSEYSFFKFHLVFNKQKKSKQVQSTTVLSKM